MAGKQKNLRLDDHYVAMLAQFAERFGRSEGEIIRTALDVLGSDYAKAQMAAKLFIDHLRERHGEARLEFRPSPKGVPHPAEVYVDGELEPDLYGPLAVRRDDRGEFESTMTLYLEPKADSALGVAGGHPSLYIGAVDWPASATGISIGIADLDPSMQEFAGLIASRGRPLHRVLWDGNSGRMVTDADLEGTSD